MSVTRLGFVGVGKHAQRMAAAFRECGAEIVAYDRAPETDSGLPLRGRPVGFGPRAPWREMLDPYLSPVDAIVCCAPPDVTAEVTAEAARVDKRVCATKPLTWLGDPDAPGVYVDLWRLYSPAWLALKADLRGREIRSVHVEFYGNGPTRASHSGLLDYGPHALAFVLGLGMAVDIEWYQRAPGQWTARDCQERIGVQTGNGFRSPMMCVRVETTDGGQYIWHERDQMQTYEAGGAILLQNRRDLALRSFCRSFLDGEPSDTLRISCEAMRMLQLAERPK